MGGIKRKSSLTDCTDRSSTRKRHAPFPCIRGMWVVSGIRCRTVNVILNRCFDLIPDGCPEQTALLIIYRELQKIKIFTMKSLILAQDER